MKVAVVKYNAGNIRSVDYSTGDKDMAQLVTPGITLINTIKKYFNLPIK